MSRRRSLNSPSGGLAEYPWWFNAGIGLTIYFGLPNVVPLIDGVTPLIVSIADMVKWLSVLFVIPILVGMARSRRRKRFLIQNRTQERISALDWREFEVLIENYYNILGYQTSRDPDDGPDGGVDVRVWDAEGSCHLIQCKHWKVEKVGVKIVRELLGVVTAEGAAGGVVVTSGTYTQDARNFARDRGVAIKLVDGNDLLQMLGGLPSRKSPSTQICPRCQSNLVLRRATKGRKKGKMFYGCESFPKCRYTRTTS